MQGKDAVTFEFVYLDDEKRTEDLYWLLYELTEEGDNGTSVARSRNGGRPCGSGVQDGRRGDGDG